MIKKITCTLLLLACFTKYSFSQINEKAILLGGQLYYQSDKINYSNSNIDQNTHIGNFQLSVGRAFKKNRVYGILAFYSPYKVENDYSNSIFLNRKGTNFGFGLYARNYYQLAKKFYFFCELGATYLNGMQKYKDTTGLTLETIKQSGGKLSLTPGLCYNIWKKLQLEILIPDLITVQYLATKDQTTTQTSNRKQFLFNTSLSSLNNSLSVLGIGFHFIL